MKAKKPHIRMGISFNEWFYKYSNSEDNGNYWANQSKLRWVDVYLHKRENYEKGKSNKMIMRSTFGNKTESEILRELEHWFNVCIGAYSYIDE